ncbi:pyridoxamine 5'-phosphate oxidase family protein [Aquimarina sp. ERC-38]|uniref:pyridoxamine 5'-phosphate oxidase family protein n=1 Tax=Aquimarina sp. ERC-38 TaxID=2949996 RepID=UPI002246EDF0|nr:pyridoxamine 5'-phosphate oxidase family protein [Aquimarina sp. ERC-38]UZO79979.1 pyridoxamine 5'-phosphate oxidase family protein [Aquimarina sp. ERC-38]
MSSYSVNNLNKVIRGSKRATYNIEEIDAIADAGFLCHVGYEFEGQTIVLPMAYGKIGQTFYLHGSLKNRMLTNLISSGKACLSITHLDGLVLARSGFHHSANYRAATIFGTTRMVQDRDEKMKALESVVNQMVPDHWDTLREMNEKEFKSTLVVAVDVTTASAKIRAEGVIDEKEDQNLPVWAGVIPIKQIAEAPITAPDVPKEVEIPESVKDYASKNSFLKL